MTPTEARDAQRLAEIFNEVRMMAEHYHCDETMIRQKLAEELFGAADCIQFAIEELER